MKKRILSAVFALLVMLTIPGVTAFAMEDEGRASDYFSYTDVRCYAEGGGLILIEVDVTAVRTMDELGASGVTIYEKQSDGSFDEVHTFYSTSTPGMTTTNSAFYSGDLYYQGVSGRQYYATCTYYARLGNTAGAKSYSSLIITA